MMKIDVCSNMTDIIQSGVILKSPGYPYTKYPKKQDCKKVFNFQKRTLYHIEFLGIFELESAECKWRDNIFGCGCDDVIEIGNYDGEQYQFVVETCGIKKPKETALIGTSVTIQFKSDSRKHYKGFSLKITILPQMEGSIEQKLTKKATYLYPFM